MLAGVITLRIWAILREDTRDAGYAACDAG